MVTWIDINECGMLMELQYARIITFLKILFFPALDVSIIDFRLFVALLESKKKTKRNSKSFSLIISCCENIHQPESMADSREYTLHTGKGQTSKCEHAEKVFELTLLVC